MTVVFSRLTPPQHQDMSRKQIEQLKDEIQENVRKLQEVEQKKLSVEEEITRSKRETERLKELVMENAELVEALKQLGFLLQEETQLSEQLHSQAASDRIQMSILEKRNKAAADKSRSLAAEIVEVKESLAKVEASKRAAQASVPMQTRKSKRKQKRE